VNQRKMDEPKNMFWGLALKPNKRYETEVQEAFRITKACVVPSTAEGKVSTVFIETENSSEDFILANLSLKNFNESLDLCFKEGEKICFKVSGPGTVHLTGNLLDLPDDDDMDFDEGDSEDDMMEELSNLKSKWTKQQLKQLNNEDSEDESDDSDYDENKTNKGDSKDGGETDEDDSEVSEDEEIDEKELSLLKKEILNTPPKLQNGASEEKNLKKEKTSSEVPKQKTQNKEKEIPVSKTSNGEKNSLNKEKKTEISEKTPKKEKDIPVLKTPNGEKNSLNKEKKSEISEKTPKKIIKNGIIIEDLVEGSGEACKSGNGVGMYYRGALKGNKKAFDACQSGKPFRFKLGAGNVIKGWDIGVAGMKVGGKRKLTIPAAMGYGKRGAPPDIPPNSTLVFDVECKFVYGGQQY